MNHPTLLVGIGGSGLKKIVPVATLETIFRWKWPDDLPESLSPLRHINIGELSTSSLFDESIDKIIDTRFGFRPRLS